jgi:hypothetical protein
MRPLLKAVLASLLALATLLPAEAGAARRHDERDVRRAVADRIGASRTAWLERRPELLVGPGPDSLVLVRTPEGGAITRGQLIDDLRRRMAMVSRIDTLSEVVDSVGVAADSAVVITSQRFMRWLRVSDSRERQRITTVTHRQVFRRTGGRWRTAGPVQEIEPRAWWADEPPAPR